MSVPENTKADIENDEPIDIAAKVKDKHTFDNGDTKVLFEDIGGEEFELKIWAGDDPVGDPDVDEWVLLENAMGDVYKGKSNVTSNHGKLSFQHLSEPPVEQTMPRPEEEEEHREKTSVLALDIETISLVSEEEFDFENSDHLELLCIGVGYSPDLGTPGQSKVLFRAGKSAADEADLLEALCDYCESHQPDRVVMFKGDFDKRQLIGRAERLNDVRAELLSRVQAIFDDHEVTNLDPWGSLEDNADVPSTYWDIYNHSLHPPEWRESHPRCDEDIDDPRVFNFDIPYFGERYLETLESNNDERERRALHELLRRYTVTDIDPLFGLVQKD